jgi:quercetin dioxygenase-like cupin family protein
MEEPLIHHHAIDYTLGALSPDEEEAFETHLAAGCEQCQSILNEHGPTPSSKVRARLMHLVRAEQIYTKRSDQGKWRPFGIPGIEMRVLYFDRDRNYATTLLRMAPGAVYPPHRHTEAEECYVLEGDVRVGAETFRAGDYQRAEAGSIHDVQSTEGGCVLLIMASLNDRVGLHSTNEG